MSDLILKLDEFTLMNRPPLDAAGKARTDERDRLNREFLSTVTRPPARGALSGTFIYAHPPDYHGRPTMDYSRQDWRDLFRELKEIGITTAILQAAAWVDFEESYYPSTLFPGFRTWNVTDPMVAAAGDEKMTLYLGCAGIIYGHVEFDIASGNTHKAREAAARELTCYRELLARYRGAFHGYYLAPETGFHPGIDPNHYRCYHEFFKRTTNGVKDLTPDMPVLTSPYTVACPGQEREAVDCLTRLHEGCPITAFAPQDSIGTFNNLTFLERGLSIWRDVCRNTGAEFWMNCESFSITNFSGPICTIVPAEFKRFAVQLDAAARLGARRLITWEAPYFLARNGTPAAQRLRREYARSRCR